MPKLLIARRLVLALIGLVFFGIALGSLIAPTAMAEPLGYELDSINAYNEFRAVYVGLWLAHVVLFWWAARDVHRLVLGNIAGLLLVGQVIGRLISVVADGVPEGPLVGTAVAELVGAILIFALRPADREQV